MMRVSLICLGLQAAHAWVPELDSTATSAQLTLYNNVRPYLPQLGNQYPRGSVSVYVYPGTGGDRSCSDNRDPLYWAWYSEDSFIPILTGFTSNGCGASAPRSCPDQKRYSGNFYRCGLSGVDHGSYTHSGFDRGHMVNSQALARMYGASCQTFSMCNVAPQSPQMNQRDWYAIEELVQEQVEAASDVIVMQGSLLRHHVRKSRYMCVCGAAAGGIVPCDQVHARGDCNVEDWQIRVPYGFFKTIIDTKEQKSWSFVYTKAQSEEGPQPTCTGVCETPFEALAAGRAGVEKLEKEAHFKSWNSVRNTAQASCGWCAEFNRTRYEALGPVEVEPELTNLSNVPTTNVSVVV
eukprot:Hpha_TRINITY_DN2552_c0_g1::TRINITY_DN2552_c0_g1_i1::g.1457::m.1457